MTCTHAIHEMHVRTLPPRVSIVRCRRLDGLGGGSWPYLALLFRLQER